MKTGRLLAVSAAALMMSVMSVIPASALTGSGNTQVKYGIQNEYVLNVPSSIVLDGLAAGAVATGQMSVTGANIEPGKSIQVYVASGSGVETGGIIKMSLIGNTAKSFNATMLDGTGGAVALNTPFVEFKTFVSGSETIASAVQVKMPAAAGMPSDAGNYSQTVTFSSKVDTII